MTNLYFPIFDKKFCARVDKKDKNLIRRPLLTREKPLEKIKCTWSSTKISVPASKKTEI